MFCDVDYHMHSCFSDGDLTPEELVDRYAANRYEEIAITDHDRIEGSMVAVAYAAGRPIRVVPGVELTSSDEDHNIIHMLGYHFRYDDRELNRTLREVSMWRARRNDALLTALREMGIYVTIDELLAVNEGRFIGKPTIAEVMVAKGYVKSVEEAFQTVFRRDEIRAVPKQMIATEKAVDLIHGAGGIAVLAHPMEIRRRGEKLSDFRNRFETVFRRVIRHGIDGMECYHPSATLLQAEELRTLARKNNLIITKGSDFHSDKARRQYEN